MPYLIKTCGVTLEVKDTYMQINRQTGISTSLCIHSVHFVPLFHLLHKTSSSALVYAETPNMTACIHGIAQCGKGTHNRSAVATHHAEKPATQTM